MPEKLEELVRAALQSAQEAGELPAFDVTEFGFERPADSANGDWSSTVAMRSARLAHCAPAKIAGAILAHMPASDAVAKVEVAGPGFINFYLNAASSNEVFRTIREQGEDYGRSDLGHGTKVQVEFVSANPVGPLHIGHGRWAALGDSLSRILEHAGYDVEREYYINDHGSQMDVFGHSVSKRYLQLVEVMEKDGCDLAAAREALLADREAFVADEADEHPETHPYTDAFNADLGGNAYGGDYIVDLAVRFHELDGLKWADATEDERMADFRERYKDEAGALWFRSTDFGDDKDRVLIKTNGEYTYFASDVAYHWNKFQRVDHVIDIWGADHHGYIQRVKSACTALGYPTQFEVLLGQLVNLLRNGQPVRMSKRKGTMVTFDELLEEVGADATRYTLVAKSNNQMIDFDIELAKKQDNTNPVYYVQYAHARTCSILRKAAGVSKEEAAELGMDEVASRAIGAEYDLGLLTDSTEAALARKLSEFGGLIESCARDRAPFRLTHYAEELAAAFHSFYAACQVLPSEGRPVEEGLSRARLAAVDATRRVLALSLTMVGVAALQTM